MKARTSFTSLVLAYLRWLWNRLFRREQQRARLRELTEHILQGNRFAAVDVGAALGLPDHWRWLDGVAYFHLIEPRGDACRDLEAKIKETQFADHYAIHEAAVFDQSGPHILYVANVPTGTSLLECDYKQPIDAVDYAATELQHPITKVEIITKRLKTLLDEVGEPAVHMIKLDVQGVELESLRGLEEGVDNLLAVELEIGLHGIYPPGHDFADIRHFLETRGLELYDVRVSRTYLPYGGDDSYYQREALGVVRDSPTLAARLWEFDGIFFRRRSELLKRGDVATIRRMLVAYMTYNYYAEALKLCSMAERAGIVSRDVAERLTGAVKRVHDLKVMRPWYLNSPINTRLLRWGQRISPRNGPRWCQHTYQGYPNG